MPPPPPAFGALLKQYRRAVGLTQAALAERAGYSTVYLGKLETGERWPLGQTVAALADALHVTPTERDALVGAAGQHVAPRRSRRVPDGGRAPVARPALPLIGRGAEQAVLQRHLAGEGPPVLLLVGDPGIGKTRLLEEVTGWGQAQGWQVLLGGCQPSSGQEPYAPVAEALAGELLRHSRVDQRRLVEGCSWLVRLFPELADAGLLGPPPWKLAPDQERRLLFAAVGRVLANGARSGGTLLVLDDLHWAGADALDLLMSLVHPATAPPVRLLGAYRPTEVRPPDPLARWLAELARLGVVELLPVPPLLPEEAATLLRTLLADRAAAAPPALEEQIVTRTGGVPYFLVSCAQGLRAGVLPGPGSDETGWAVPWNVAETIRQRVATLPASAQYLLGVVSIVGQNTPRALLLGLASQLGWGKLEVLEAVEHACHVRLLEEVEEGIYRFPHDLIRDVIGVELSGLRRVIVHQQIAAMLEQQPGEPPVERLAYHYLHGEQPEQAIRYLELAGDHAAALYAHAEAEQAYRELLSQATHLGRAASVAAAQEKLGGILRVMGRYPEALELLEAVRATYQVASDRETLARALGELGQLHAARGAAGVGIALLDPWLAALPAGAISAQRQGGLAVTLAYLFLNSGRPLEALAAAEQAAACAEQAQDDRLLGQAQWHLGRSLLVLDRLEEAAQRFAAALPLAQQTGDGFSVCIIQWNLGLIATSRGDLPASSGCLERALAVAEQLDHPYLLAQVLACHAYSVWWRGAWKQSRQEYERAIALMRELGLPWGASYPLLNYGLQVLAEGEEEAGCAALEEAIRLAQGTQDRQAECLAQGVLATYDLVCGRPAQALQRLQPLLESADPKASEVIACLPNLAWATLEAGDEVRAQQVVDQALARTRERQLRGALAEALQVQARVAAHGRRWAQAKRALEEAICLARTMGSPYDEARALCLAGQVSLQAGKREPARQQFVDALGLLEQLGERLHARQVERALLDLGVPTTSGRGPA